MSSSPAAAKKGSIKQSKKLARTSLVCRMMPGNIADFNRLFDIVKKEKGHMDVLFASTVSYTKSLC